MAERPLEVYCVLIPLAEGRLLLPRSCVAEVVAYAPPVSMPGAPAWYLGTVPWSARSVPLMTAPPETYYEMLEERLPGHGQPVGTLRERGILLDGTTQGEKRLLLQIFSECLFGPVFFEFIERKGDQGFGEGNFKALFESMERDQLRRGALKA